MGQGIIKAGIGDGQYNIDAILSTSRAAAELENIPYKIAALLKEETAIQRAIEEAMCVPDDPDEPDPEEPDPAEPDPEEPDSVEPDPEEPDTEEPDPAEPDDDSAFESDGDAEINGYITS